MFSTDFIFRQLENLVDNQKCQAGFRLQTTMQQNTISFILCLFLYFLQIDFFLVKCLKLQNQNLLQNI